MLKKLFKHEWMETWKIPVLIFTVSLVLSAICALYFHLAPSLTPDVEINLGNMTLFILYSFAVSMSSWLITIYLGIRFYKNLYTDEGYLMHTLPVHPWMLLLSKTFVGALWIYLAGILLFGTILPVTCIALPKLAYFNPEELEEIIPVMTSILGKGVPHLLFFFIFYSLASAASSILLLYAAISLGQLFGKHKVLSSIICYLGLNALLSTVSSILMVPGLTGVVITHVEDTENFYELVIPSLMHTTYIIGFFASLLLAAICFFLCNYLLKRCLNLD